ncbi:hypothetical protein LAZ67_9001568 [Cordylochernes scorpioides]|uniref:Gag-Pol-p199 n=1 Tax=Cordylochernes scorpioides TaxID=51811 RepID=A0ABY6KTK7_9ARAC|nr:hypothetical protein LAZ67_9001568 [Cordylochernes scorpioides]
MKEAENQTGFSLKRIRTDKELEFCSSPWDIFTKAHGIVHERTMVYTPEQNGVAERMNRTLLNLVRSTVNSCNLPTASWAELTNTAAYLRNRVTNRHNEEKTPFELWFGKRPALQHLRAIGSETFAHVPKQRRNSKLQPRATKGIIVGYSLQGRGWRIWIPEKRQVGESRNCVFKEEILYKQPKRERDTLPSVHFTSKEASFQEESDADQPVDRETEELIGTTGGIDQLSETLPENLRSHPMTLRSHGKTAESPEEDNSGGQINATSAEDNNPTYEEAMNSPEQQKKDWFIDQFDVKSAYLHGTLNETIYMEQPECFKKPGEENLFCKLKKSIYGLKQSGRCWNKFLTKQLHEIGFQRNPIDPSIYEVELEEGRIILSIYVDDIFAISENQAARNKCRELLNSSFEVKYLGPISHMLGVSFKKSEDGNYRMQKGVSTPMETNLDLSVRKNRNSNERFPYRELIGGLSYLSHRTRPDIAYAVGTLSRYCDNYTRKHWEAGKRVLRYLKSTKDFGITYRSTGTPLIAFSDASWASDIVDRKGVSGHLIILAGAPIIWRSTKQTVTALSTMESEYIALSSAVKDIIWVRNLKEQLKMSSLICGETKVFCDNQAAISHAENYIDKSKTRHFAVKYHFVREKISEEAIELFYTPSAENPADFLTKPLARSQHEKYCRALMDYRNKRPAEVIPGGDMLDTSAATQANCNDSHVLLATARIKIKNGLGKLCTCRALLDSGSQVTMITKGCCERLGLVQRKSDRMIIGVGNTPVQHSSSTVGVTFCPLNNSEEFSVEAVVTGVLTSEIPNFRLKDPNWPTLKNLKLADPEFYIQAPIDMILGADIYTELMLNGSISLGEGLPMAINTRLGWVLLGKLMGTSESNTEVCNLSLQSEPELEFVMKRFWETESVPSPDLCTQEEDCERLFSNNHGRDSHGRYWVKLPFRQHRPLLGESREKALRRFLLLERKLCKNVKLYDQYRGFMKEYEHLNHMERVPIAEVKRELCRCYYMPHHPEDADYQRILWKPSPEEPVVDYRLLTVTYGTTSAPFLAMRTLQQLAEDEGQNYPEASRVTLNDFYVDDLLTGAQTIAEAKELIDQLKDLMKKGGFHLRKWNSNCHEIVSHVEEMNEEKKINLEKGAISKILGIVWDHVQDTFRVNITLPEEVVTKRDLLSNIARIFDPIGFLSPTTVAMANLQRQTAVKEVEDLEGLPVYHRAILKENGEWPEVTKAIQCSYPKVFVGDGTHLYLLIEDVESLDGPNVRSVLYQYRIPHKKWIWRKVNGFAPIVISKSIVYASHDKRVYFVGGRIHSRGNKVTCTDNIVRVKLKEGRASVLVKSRKSPLTDLLVLATTFAPSAFLFMLAETRDHSTYKVFSYHLLNKDWHLSGSDKIFWKEKFLSLQICYTNKKLLLFPRMQWEQHFCNLYNYRLQTDSWGCYTTIPILGEKEGYPKNINHFTIVQDWVRAVFVHAGKESKYLWKLNLKSKQWTELPTYVKYRDSQYTAVALDLVFILGPADKEHETAEKYLSFFKTRSMKSRCEAYFVIRSYHIVACLPYWFFATTRFFPSPPKDFLSSTSPVETPFFWQYLSALPLVGGHEKLTRRVVAAAVDR